MRLLCVCLVFMIAAGFAAASKPHPIDAKEISLMLRSGYSAAAVEKETAARHFIGTISDADEKALLATGASRTFLDALENGRYAIPAEEVEAATRSLASEASRRALQAEQAHKAETLYQQQQSQARSAATTTTVPLEHALAPLLRGDLVTSRNGILSPFNDQTIEKKKLIALY
ncbi:MAG: hypothetical protein M3Y86_01005, partial [Verrucomicrobiota bacterium]|nr:hypothetical protein [Verrucomicrobiota bacterium]